MSAPKRHSRSAREWYAFTGRHAQEILRRWPAALPNPRLRVCPRHQVVIGQTTRMCLACHHEGWDEVAREFVASQKGAAA